MKPLAIDNGQTQAFEDMAYAEFPAWATDTSWAQTQRGFASQWSRATPQISQTISDFGTTAGSASWFGGVLAANGYIYGAPRAATTVLKINTANDTVSTFGSLSANTQKWHGAVLGPPSNG
ncbi:MAG: hypothetical protein ACYS7Y_32370 [Planctomycetota bacterium]|jgi:hypothetical protein